MVPFNAECPKMVGNILKIVQHLLRVSDHFGTLYINSFSSGKIEK